MNWLYPENPKNPVNPDSDSLAPTDFGHTCVTASLCKPRPLALHSAQTNATLILASGGRQMALNAKQTLRPDDCPKLALRLAAGDSPDYLRRVVDLVQQGDSLEPVTIVGPSVYANLTLRHELGRSGFANVRFLVFPRLAEFLGAPSLASQGRRPLTPVLENAAIRAVTANSSGDLSEVSSHSSTITSIRRTFRQIRHASQEALGPVGRAGRSS